MASSAPVQAQLDFSSYNSVWVCKTHVGEFLSFRAHYFCITCMVLVFIYSFLQVVGYSLMNEAVGGSKKVRAHLGSL